MTWVLLAILTMTDGEGRLTKRFDTQAACDAYAAKLHDLKRFVGERTPYAWIVPEGELTTRCTYE